MYASFEKLKLVCGKAADRRPVREQRRRQSNRESARNRPYEFQSYLGATVIGDPQLAARLESALEGEVLFDSFSRGRYATDASHYQIEPIGVAVPRSRDDVVRTIEIAGEMGVPLLPRGGGTSQCGQTVGALPMSSSLV